MEVCRYKVYIQRDSLVTPFLDKMDEWLRRLTVNTFASARLVSNPIFVVFLIGSMVKWMATCSLNSPIQIQISKKPSILKNLGSHLL